MKKGNPKPKIHPKFLEVAHRQYGDYSSPIGDKVFAMRFPLAVQERLLSLPAEERIVLIRDAVEASLNGELVRQPQKVPSMLELTLSLCLLDQYLDLEKPLPSDIDKKC